jgi:hypothetical protein
MISGVRRFPIYLVVITACYALAWFIACVVVNGGFAHSAEYLRLFWTSGGGERPMFTGLLSIVLTIPFSLVAIWLLRRSLKKKNEKRA